MSDSNLHLPVNRRRHLVFRDPNMAPHHKMWGQKNKFQEATKFFYMTFGSVKI